MMKNQYSNYESCFNVFLANVKKCYPPPPELFIYIL